MYMDVRMLREAWQIFAPAKSAFPPSMAVRCREQPVTTVLDCVCCPAVPQAAQRSPARSRASRLSGSPAPRTGDFLWTRKESHQRNAPLGCRRRYASCSAPDPGRTSLCACSKPRFEPCALPSFGASQTGLPWPAAKARHPGFARRRSDAGLNLTRSSARRHPRGFRKRHCTLV